MSDALSAIKDFCGKGRSSSLILCCVLFLVAVALLLCGLISPCIAGALIFLGLALCCCAACAD